MPIKSMVTISEEIQEKMKGLYHRYQQLQRDGSVSMLDAEKQTLLDIHKALFKTNFCTTCQEAVLFALNLCFRNYHLEVVHTEEFNSADVEAFGGKYDFNKVISDISPETLNNPTIAKEYIFAGSNKQWKQLKAAFSDVFTIDRNKTITEGSILHLEIIHKGWAGWFKEV